MSSDKIVNCAMKPKLEEILSKGEVGSSCLSVKKLNLPLWEVENSSLPDNFYTATYMAHGVLF